MAAIFLSLGASAAPNARFYGLSSGNASAFTASPNGSAVSILFDNLQLERANSSVPPKNPAERHFTLAASPGAKGCRATFALRGGSIALNTPRVGTIILNVEGRRATLRPEEDSWTFTVEMPLARRERTDVTVSLDLPLPAENGSALIVVDSVDVSLGKCGGKA
ncbi:MAG: hypothetical protein K2Y20_03885 [Sphingomonas sp.]|nr:hypothetical protein [Sphingomonas sp.]